ncbi:MAG: 30S ribosome-binding factor RbfA [Acidobacteria bacterium]|jgi:ribosome-binding factor A|nr:30S ribosome-binding factor RbfA [Acidobacteriota bacterium]
MSHRLERFSSTLKQNLADILLNEAANPHFKQVIITDIVVTPDLKKARIYITTPPHDTVNIIRQLDQAKGFIKKILAQKMYLRYVPELTFVSTPPDIFSNLQKEVSDDTKTPDAPGSPGTPGNFDLDK